jgi:hypothetical protein
MKWALLAIPHPFEKTLGFEPFQMAAANTPASSSNG